MNRSRILSVSLLLLVLGCKGRDKDKDVIDSDISFDKVNLTDLENNPISMGQYKGKTIFINFWATWCKPCIAEMPSIQNAQDVLRNEGVVFLLASNESIEEINSFRNAHNYNFNYTRIDNSEELNIQGLPTTFIFDQKGQLVFSEMGARKWDEKDNIDMVLKILNKNE
jgi:thiol-disulfide isomerase/thioredoxin